MKKFISILLVVLISITLIPISAYADLNEKESNNTYETANIINDGNIVSAAINSYDDIDIFKFTAPANGKADIYFLHNYDSNTRIEWSVKVYLYNGKEYECLSSTYIESKDSENYKIPTTGLVCGQICYIEIKKTYYDETVGIEYQLQLDYTDTDSYEKENNNSYKKATDINKGTYTGVINSYDDIDIFKFIAPANGKADIYFLHSYDSNTRIEWSVKIYLYNGNEYECLSYTDISGEDSESYKMPTAGLVCGQVCYIEVKKTYYDETIGVDYQLQFNYTNTGNYEIENNNSYRKATDINKGTYTGVINSYDDIDIFKFTAPANGKADIYFLHSYDSNTRIEWSVKIYLYNGKEYECLSSTCISAEDSENYKLPATGLVYGQLCYIEVKKTYFDETIGVDYQLQLDYTDTDFYEKENNDSYKKATKILKGIYSGNINNDSDKDFYEYTLNSTDKLCVEFLHNYDSNTRIKWLVNIYLYDNGEYIKIKNKEICAEDNNSCIIINDSETDGIYYITIEKLYYDDTIGVNYQLKISEKNVFGDVNGDEKINTKDARLILRYVAKLEKLSTEQKKIADVNNDTKVNTKDARKVLRVVAKLETL